MFTLDRPTDRPANKPDFTIKLRKGRGKEASYQPFAVAWKNKDGSFTVELDRHNPFTGVRIYPSAEIETELGA